MVAFYFCLPQPLFDDPYSTVVNDKNGNLIGARIAEDGQWRFPEIDSVPLHFRNAIITYEDKRFCDHIGIDLRSIGRALIQNIKAKEIKSGASTITMQIMRMSRKGEPRTYFQKIIETILALRSELSYSKEELLNIYASHAPFGGNVVGLEAASWRYFQKSPDMLTIAEAAMLAVLPNAPSLIHLSKNRELLLRKRNGLLKAMAENEFISDTDLELSMLEKIPAAPYPLPSLSYHLTEFVHRQHPEDITQTTIDRNIQQIVNEVSNYYYNLYQQTGIHNQAVLVMDTYTGEVLGYLGNCANTKQEWAVDMVHAERSSGSVLKPFLFAHLLNEGKYTPKSLIRDTPVQFSGFRPENYNRQFQGAIPLDEALARSLNVPFVNMLKEYGIDPMLNRLKEHGFTTLDKTADHYGLSLILGGGEVSLWELAGAYASMARILLEQNQSGKYYTNISPQPRLTKSTIHRKQGNVKPHTLSSGAVYETLKACQKLQRPDEEGQWEQFESAKLISWKTGTSFGHRDAWAVGVTPRYTIGVWVGNADGESVSTLVGVKKAAPILFDILNRLPDAGFFSEPADEYIRKPICRKSGYVAGRHCEPIDTNYQLFNVERTKPCPYHRLVHLDQEGYQVNSQCVSPSAQIHKKWFTLPPSMAHYYQTNHPAYKTIPDYRPDCTTGETSKVIDFLYPVEHTSVYLPIDLDGRRKEAVFKVSHQNPESTLYWHIDDEYIGYTEQFHSMKISADQGDHIVTVIDQWGNTSKQKFEIIGD